MLHEIAHAPARTLLILAFLRTTLPSYEWELASAPAHIRYRHRAESNGGTPSGWSLYDERDLIYWERQALQWDRNGRPGTGYR